MTFRLPVIVQRTRYVRRKARPNYSNFSTESNQKQNLSSERKLKALSSGCAVLTEHPP